MSRYFVLGALICILFELHNKSDRYYNLQFVKRKKGRKRTESLRIHEISSKVKQLIMSRQRLKVRSSYAPLHPTVRCWIIFGQKVVMTRAHMGERNPGFIAYIFCASGKSVCLSDVLFCRIALRIKANISKLVGQLFVYSINSVNGNCNYWSI